MHQPQKVSVLTSGPNLPQLFLVVLRINVSNGISFGPGWSKDLLILFGLPMSYYRPKMTRDSFDPLCLRYLSVLKVSGCDKVCMRGPMVLVVLFECEL